MAKLAERARSRTKPSALLVLMWIAGSIFCLLALGFIAGEILGHRARPILEAKIVDALSTRFDSRVQLDSFHVDLYPIRVSGAGLRLYPRRLQSQYPLIAVKNFSFTTQWSKLLQSPMRIDRVSIRGLAIHLPPKAERPDSPRQRQSDHIKMLIKEIDSDGATLVIENGKPGKTPLKFEISGLRLTSAGAGRAMNFQATLVNPKPLGNIATAGYFGPFQEESPGDTAVGGQYSFRNADLATLKGIAGTLSSQGKYQGTLDNIVVDGETSTPDFQLDIAGHPVPLNTTFHAIVDGINGNTHLQPVDAWLLHSYFVARGEVVREPHHPGHDIQLDVTTQSAQIQDILALGQKTGQPLISGDLRMHTSFHLAPCGATTGGTTVIDRLQMRGSFAAINAHFTDEKFQSKVDQLSLRGLGKARQASQESRAEKHGAGETAEANTAFAIRGDFSFGEGKVSLRNFAFQAPGAIIALNGDYSVKGEQLNFRGKARLDAKLAQTVTGWKSLLLMPLDPIFSKGGSGTQIPIDVTGTRSHPHIGLNFDH